MRLVFSLNIVGMIKLCTSSGRCVQKAPRIFELPSTDVVDDVHIFPEINHMC